MTICTWFVQSNLNAVEKDKIQYVCEGLGIPCKPFKLKPFMDKMPTLKASSTDPFVLIGSTTLNYNALKSRKYKRGIWFNNNFKPSCYLAGYGANFLNHDQSVYKIKDLPVDLFDKEERVFLRSNDDTKQISGGSVLFKELLEIQENTMSMDSFLAAGDSFNKDSEIVVASLKNIYAEYRLIVLGQEIIGYSRYQPSKHYSVPQDIMDFAKSMLGLWKPHHIHTLDIAETDNGLKVIECNCVNGAGWYDADYSKVVEELTQWQIQQWNLKQNQAY